VYFSINGPGSQEIIIYDYVLMLNVDQVHRYSILSPTANLKVFAVVFLYLVLTAVMFGVMYSQFSVCVQVENMSGFHHRRFT